MINIWLLYEPNFLTIMMHDDVIEKQTLQQYHNFCWFLLTSEKIRGAKTANYIQADFISQVLRADQVSLSKY